GGAIQEIDRIDPDTLGRALVELAQSRVRREELSGRGLVRAASFSWERAARESLEIYRETATAHSRAIAGLKPATSPSAIDGRHAAAPSASQASLKAWADVAAEAART